MTVQWDDSKRVPASVIHIRSSTQDSEGQLGRAKLRSAIDAVFDVLFQVNHDLPLRPCASTIAQGRWWTPLNEQALDCRQVAHFCSSSLSQHRTSVGEQVTKYCHPASSTQTQATHTTLEHKLTTQELQSPMILHGCSQMTDMQTAPILASGPHTISIWLESIPQVCDGLLCQLRGRQPPVAGQHLWQPSQQPGEPASP